MAGASYDHSVIVGNVVGELRTALRGRCTVLPSDMKIRIEATNRYVYPDASVVCAAPEFVDEHRDAIKNPVVIVEVLSDSTEAYDRGDKFEQYRTLASLQEFILVSQKQRKVEQFLRQPDGTWLLRALRDGDRLVIGSAGCEVAVDDLYLGALGVAAPV